jgi:hypothetical protein
VSRLSECFVFRSVFGHYPMSRNSNIGLTNTIVGRDLLYRAVWSRSYSTKPGPKRPGPQHRSAAHHQAAVRLKSGLSLSLSIYRLSLSLSLSLYLFCCCASPSRPSSLPTRPVGNLVRLLVREPALLITTTRRVSAPDMLSHTSPLTPSPPPSHIILPAAAAAAAALQRR